MTKPDGERAIPCKGNKHEKVEIEQKSVVHYDANNEQDR